MTARKPVSFQVELSAGRTVMDRRAVPIWRPTGMDGWILNYTEAGAGRIGSGRTGFTTSVGQFLLFKPLAIHDYGADDAGGHWTHLWVYFFPRPAWYDWLVWPEAAPGILRIDLAGNPLADRAVSAFRDVIAAAHGPWARRVALATNAVEQVLLWCDAARGGPAGQPLDERIRVAVEACHERYARAWTVAALARLGGLSASRFAHLFRQQLGVAPLAYLEQVRLRAAQGLLLGTGRRIADIAAEVGISDPAWFAQRFRRWAGVSPRRFRTDAGKR